MRSITSNTSIAFGSETMRMSTGPASGFTNPEFSLPAGWWLMPTILGGAGIWVAVIMAVVG